MRGLLVVVLAAACSQPPPLTSCDESLRGVWRAGDRRWMILDAGRTLEIYPLFPDGDPAPRVIDLERGDDGLRGRVKRRYMRGATSCIASATATVTSCSGDALDLVLADPQPPLAFDPCTWGAPAPSRRERWRRE